MLPLYRNLYLYLPIAILLVYAIYEQISFGVGTINKALYVLFIASSIYSSIILGVKFNQKHIITILVLSTINIMWLIPASQNGFSNYVIIDFLILQFLIVQVIYARFAVSLANNSQLVATFIILLVSVELYFVILGSDNPGGRFNPINIFFLTQLVWLVFCLQRKMFILGLGVIAMIISLVYMSGERTTLLLSILVLMLFAAPPLLKNTTSTILLILLIMLLGYLLLNVLGELILSSRFNKLVGGEVDGSLLQRVYEFFDIIEHFDMYGWHYSLTGFGHGAMYLPQTSFSEVNVQPNGMVHHIHITPVLVFFRYGLIGCVIYLVIWWHCIKALLRHLRVNSFSKFITVALLCYLLSSLLRNVLVDPFFLISLSLFYYIRPFKNAKA